MLDPRQGSVPFPRPSDPYTPPFTDDLEYVTAYLTARMLSDPSRIYSYLLWAAIALVFLLCSILHHTRARAGYLGAWWTKLTVRRRTWRKKHALAANAAGAFRQPYSFPSVAQILTCAAIALAALALTTAGPDYLAPGARLWSLGRFPAATETSLAGRAYDNALYARFQPQYTIPKAWWTAGSRAGLTAFALFPLCVLLVLKAPPFALFALPFAFEMHFDKLIWLHKWIGRLIYALVCAHVALWSVQLVKDRRPTTGRMVYVYAWDYDKFWYAWAAFGCLTLLVLLSIGPLRKYHYESFWFLHVLLVPLTLIMSALHHPPVWYWCWAALGLWIGERSWRLTWWLYTNGFVGGMKPDVPAQPPPTPFPASPLQHDQKESQVSLYPPTPSPARHHGIPWPCQYVPPPGFAHLELLPGRTVKLRLITPGHAPWAPGQHFLLGVPAVSRFTTHPFTAASICDETHPDALGRTHVFLIRAKTGWTKDLWDTVALMISRGERAEGVLGGHPLPPRGVLLRACVDGPFGSCRRTRWGDYASVLLVAGGAGVSFALAVLQYVALCMAGQDGRFLGGKAGACQTTRVRLVWLVREFGHIQWCASILRRVRDILPGPELQIDIYVTNVQMPIMPVSAQRQSWLSSVSVSLDDDGELQPPRPGFARPGSRARHTRPTTILDDESDRESDIDLSYYLDPGARGDGDEHVLDYTNFDGDDDTALPGEAELHRTVQEEGWLRRASTRSKAQRPVSASAYGPGAHAASPSRARLLGGGSSRPDLAQIDTEKANAPESLGDGRARRAPALSPIKASPLSAAPLLDARSSRRLSRQPSPSPSPTPTPTHAPARSDGWETPNSGFRPDSRASAWTDAADSLAGLVAPDAARERQLFLDLDAREMESVRIVAERARPGKPRLDRILSDEVERAAGAVIVGCCGPPSLGVMMRKTVAAQIDPGRIRRGDMRGLVALVTEEFEY